MLISVRHLIDRARHPRSRADELAKLRARLAAQPSRWQVDGEHRASAARLRSLRIALSAALGEVDACGGCAKGHPEPAGHWRGGHCCGGSTLDIFSSDEVGALKLAGTKPSHWAPPRGDHAGCAFRGETGCSLPPVHRPSICVRYICLELRAELREQPKWQRVSQLARAIDDEMKLFAELRRGALSSPARRAC